jgi:hypothetical protein
VGNCACRKAVSVAIGHGDYTGVPKERSLESDETPPQSYRMRQLNVRRHPTEFVEAADGSRNFNEHVAPAVLIPQLPTCTCSGNHVASVHCFSTCPRGHAWGDSAPIKKTETVKTVVYYSNGILEHSQHSRRCTGPCSCTLKYDGLEDDLVMVNSRFGVSVALLDAFFVGLYTMGATATGFAASQQVHYETLRGPEYFRANPDHVLSRGRLQTAVVAYRSIVDYTKHEKSCDICGDSPSTVVCDGIVQGVLAAQLAKLPPDNRHVVESVVAVGRDYDASFFVPPKSMDKDLYTQLLRFVRAPPTEACPLGMPHAPIITLVDPALTMVEADEMLKQVVASSCPRLKSLSELLEEAVKKPIKLADGRDVCEPAYAHVLFPLLVHSTAFAAYKPADVASVLDELHGAATATAHAAIMPRVNELLPWVSFFLRDVGADKLPDYAKPAVKAVADCARALASWEQMYRLVKGGPKTTAKTLEQLRNGNADERAAAAEIENALVFDERSSSELVEEDLSLGRYFGPGLRWQRRGRFNYEVDGGAANVKIFGKRECTKESPTTHSHSPGIFCVLCPHGVVYAMTLMRSAESPAHLFDLLFSRFRKLPALVLYDNACNEMRYCVRREPGMLATQTRFAVDRLHWANHVRCSTTFRMYEHSVFNDVIKYTDSQRAEQYNKLLTRIETIIHFSTAYNAICALRGFAATAEFFRQRASAQPRRGAAKLIARGAAQAPPQGDLALGALDDAEQQHDEVDAEMHSDDDDE